MFCSRKQVLQFLRSQCRHLVVSVALCIYICCGGDGKQNLRSATQMLLCAHAVLWKKDIITNTKLHFLQTYLHFTCWHATSLEIVSVIRQISPTQSFDCFDINALYFVQKWHDYTWNKEQIEQQTCNILPSTTIICFHKYYLGPNWNLRRGATGGIIYALILNTMTLPLNEGKKKITGPPQNKRKKKDEPPLIHDIFNLSKWSLKQKCIHKLHKHQ